MAIKRRPGRGIVKSETLTVRLDDRSRFAIDFIARATGQPIGTWLERTAIAQAIALAIEGRVAHGTFSKVWHAEAGARMLALAAEEGLYPTEEELRRLAFARQFRAFFYRDDACTEFHIPRIQALWGHVDELIAFFEETRSEDFFAVARRMAEMLKKAGLEPPTKSEIQEAGR